MHEVYYVLIISGKTTHHRCLVITVAWSIVRQVHERWCHVTEGRMDSMIVGSLCFIFCNQSLGKRWVMVMVWYQFRSLCGTQTQRKDQTERGELGIHRTF